MLNEYKNEPNNNINNTLLTKKLKKNENLNENKDSYIKNENLIKTKESIFKNFINYFKESNVNYKERSQSFDELIDKFSNLSLYERLFTNIELSKINKQSKNTFEVKKIKRNYVIKGMNITEYIEIIDNSKYKYIPYKIKYKDEIFYIRGANPINNLRVTWRCINYRIKRNLPENQNIFCDAKIQGIRENKDTGKFKYFIQNDHSDICKYKNKETIKKGKFKNQIIDNLKKIKLSINKITKKKFTKNLEDFLKDNKNNKITCKDFISYGKNIYNNNNNLENKFTIDDVYLKNIYYKIRKNLLHLNLEDVYDYSKLNNSSNFCRCVTVKQLVTKNKKTIDHKAIIFFSDFYIKRFINNEYILLDGTFIYPTGFMQTIIFMYFDNITDKMIPGIFIIINNKTYEGYVDCFIYIKNYIDRLNNNEKIKIKTFTTIYEIALYHAFDIVFNKNKNIRHIGCYFHFLQNIRKFLQKNNLTTLKTKPIYNVVIKFCKKLPFENLDIDSIKKNMVENFKKYNKEL